MLTKSLAIVLSSLKYRDSDLIVKCYTLQRGTISYLIRGILKPSKRKLKPALFQPLAQLSLDENYNPKASLHTIKEVKVEYHYNALYTNVIKSSIALFLSEVLTTVLREEEPQEELFHFLVTSMQVLDQEEKVANFHLLFLVKLTKYLGIYPDERNKDLPYFNLKDSKFEPSVTDKYSIEGKNIELLKTFLGTNFDALNTLRLSSKERQIFLNALLVYFELHLAGFKRPKSLDVLNSLFN